MLTDYTTFNLFSQEIIIVAYLFRLTSRLSSVHSPHRCRRRSTPKHLQILFSCIIIVWSVYVTARIFFTEPSAKTQKTVRFVFVVFLHSSCSPKTCPPILWRSSSSWRYFFCYCCLEFCGRFWKNSYRWSQNASKEKSCWWVVSPI